MNTANLRVLTDVALPRYLSQSIEFLKSKCGGSIVDLQAVFHEITSQLMGKMAYNVRASTFTFQSTTVDGAPQMEMHSDDEFTVAFDYASGATTERFQNPLWPVTEVFLGSRLRNSIAIVKAFGKRIVAKAVADRREGVPASCGKLDQISGSLIQSLLDAIDDEKLVADAALNYLSAGSFAGGNVPLQPYHWLTSAGRDTTAQALTWTFYTLMKQQYVTKKIRREVQQLLEGQDSFDPTLFTPAAMPYTMAVFYESLRLYPPIPFEMKQCSESAALPDGTLLPKDCIVFWSPWAMNRSVTTWGQDADSFRPERWLVDGKLIAKSASEFPVFNGGPRTCLGKRMAELIAVQTIASVAWTFDFAPADDAERVSKTSLTLPMDGGLPCLVKLRAGALP